MEVCVCTGGKIRAIGGQAVLRGIRWLRVREIVESGRYCCNIYKLQNGAEAWRSRTVARALSIADIALPWAAPANRGAVITIAPTPVFFFQWTHHPPPFVPTKEYCRIIARNASWTLFRVLGATGKPFRAKQSRSRGSG